MMAEYNKNAVSEVGTLEVKTVAAAVTLTKKDRMVEIITNGTYTITLPPIAECIGLIFVIFQSGAGTNTVTISDNNATYGDSLSWTDQVLNATGERVVLLATNKQWIVLVGQTS